MLLKGDKWLITSLVVLLIQFDVTSAEDGNFTNEFVAYVKGSQENVEKVLSDLKNVDSVHMINVIKSEKFGYVISFKVRDIHALHKRSAGDHPLLLALTDNAAISSIEQQTQVIREKRDYFTQDQIELARQIVKKYLSEEAHRISLAKKAKAAEEQESVIEHDKARELDEPQLNRFYEDKSVFKRYKTPEELNSLEQRDYKPSEDRCNTIKLTDEHWKDQWYLNNCGQAGGPTGLDINVVPAWQQGFSGRNVSVCILDDGIEHSHDDLKDNYWAEISADFNNPEETGNDPTPNRRNLDENSHGTKCAGEVAAKANNSICGVGVAFNSRIGGIRILDGPVTDSLEARALLFNNQLIDIYSASWGPKDNGKTMEGPGKHCSAALEQGAKEGRGGKGSIFVWATGNGGYVGDDCGADGYVSSIYTLSIGSINNYGESTYFMEWCPSTMAVIFTGGYHDKEQAISNDESKHPMLKVVTTDVRNKCTLNFQGTSSAAPMAAGVVALTLEANPNLTWRDVQHIVVRTAKIPNTVEKGWTINGAGYHINDKFGYGVLDAAQMVQVAQSWSNVGPQHRCQISSEEAMERKFSQEYPLELTINTDGCQRTENRVDKLEHVQLYINLSHPRRGDIKLTLTSPAGTSSEMLSPRRMDDATTGIDFTFMTVRCWDENPRGTWKLTVSDSGNTDGGVVHTWSLTLLGTASAAMARQAGEPNRKAYIPDTEHLGKLAGLESEAALNVQIKKGSEEDVIRNFSPDSDASGLGDKVRKIAGNMDVSSLQDILAKLEYDVRQAKRREEAKEIKNVLSDLYNSP